MSEFVSNQYSDEFTAAVDTDPPSTTGTPHDTGANEERWIPASDDSPGSFPTGPDDPVPDSTADRPSTNQVKLFWRRPNPHGRT